MANFLRRPFGLALGALATASLGGCYYGDVNGYGSSYAGNDCVSRYGDAYYDYDPYAYDDGYGYDCYDGGDYGAGFVNIGFGGGWYDNYYYPGSGLWLFDSYNNRYPLRGQYLNYWGGRRAWWKHHGGRGDGHWNGPGRGDGPRGDGPRPGRGDDNKWDLRGDRDRDNDGPRGARPPRPGAGSGTTPPPTATTPVRPDRPDRGPGAGRPRPSQEGASGMSRPRQQWQGGNPGNGSSVGAAPRPGRPMGTAPRPAPSQAAPPVRSAPPAVRSAPPPPAASAPRPSSATRVSPADRPNRVRED